MFLRCGEDDLAEAEGQEKCLQGVDGFVVRGLVGTEDHGGVPVEFPVRVREAGDFLARHGVAADVEESFFPGDRRYMFINITLYTAKVYQDRSRRDGLGVVFDPFHEGAGRDRDQQKVAFLQGLSGQGRVDGTALRGEGHGLGRDIMAVDGRDGVFFDGAGHGASDEAEADDADSMDWFHCLSPLKCIWD